MNFPEPDVAVDLSTCAAEPIHIIGRIQSFGYLIAVSSDWIVAHASENCAALFERPFDELIGSPAADFIAREALHEVRSRLQMIEATDSVDRIFGIDLRGDGRLFDLAVHASGRSYILEVEPANDERRRDYIGYVRPMVERMRQSSTIEDLCRIAARQLRGLTGFDRVMVYRFEPDGAGEVIAESLRNGVDSFLGLHFPASDIPAQARKLYTRNMLRIITDVADPTVPILPATNPDGMPLDLSMSGLRAVSPIHIEYLKNMGVEASMSVSLMRGGELWGLMACHHYAPLHLDYPVRTAAELFGEFMSFLLEQTEMRQTNDRRVMSLKLHDEIMARVATGSGLIAAFDGFAASIAKAIPYDSIAGWIGGELVSIGKVPDKSHFAALARFLNTTGNSRVWHSNNLVSVHPPARDYTECCAGVLALPVSRSPRDYILLFRKEQASAVNWAGNPHKPVEYGPNGARLHPRQSFALWKEERKGYSAPWTSEEVSIAESLRVTLIEVVLRMSDAAQEERAQALRKQDTLIAELNHRVRNILNLIRGLASQSKEGAQSLDDFVKVLSDRIYALARAHDQVTQMNWSPASLVTLIRAECKAYVNEKSDRIMITGTDVMIDPSSFSTLALVFHELTTNSCKYGALSDQRGQVEIKVARNAAGGADIDWTERGGPVVNPPRRRGFGSSIIENAVTHELGGKAAVYYDPLGLRAEFTVPARHIAGFRTIETDAEAPDVATPGQTDAALLTGDVLVVEDNLIISMEAESILAEFGAANVHVAASVASALDIVRSKELSFALLDVNLGAETSERIGMALTDLGVPYVIASGYGGVDVARWGPSARHAVTKPYTKGELGAAIARLQHDLGETSAA